MTKYKELTVAEFIDKADADYKLTKYSDGDTITYRAYWRNYTTILAVYKRE